MTIYCQLIHVPFLCVSFFVSFDFVINPSMNYFSFIEVICARNPEYAVVLAHLMPLCSDQSVLRIRQRRYEIEKANKTDCIVLYEWRWSNQHSHFIVK